MITLVVVNFKTSTDLFDFCKSYEENPPSVESQLVIVNNEPEEADMKVANHFVERGTCQLHIAQENLYYSGALNRAGMMVPNWDVIAYFNADTQLTPGVIDSCYDLIMDNDDIGVVGPAQVNKRGDVTHAGIFGTLAAPKHRGWKDRWRTEYEDVADAVTVSGSAYFVRRECYEDQDTCSLYRELHPDVEGPFLPTNHYYEETWFSYHAQAHGWRVVYNGQASMIHEWHKATPVGGWAEQQMPHSRKMFREMCDHHDIDHD